MPNGIQCLRSYLLTLHIPTLLFWPWGDRCFAPNCSGCLHSRTSARSAGYHEVEVKGANWVHQAFCPRMENGKWERNSFGQPFCLGTSEYEKYWKVLCLGKDDNSGGDFCCQLGRWGLLVLLMMSRTCPQMVAKYSDAVTRPAVFVSLAILRCNSWFQIILQISKCDVTWCAIFAKRLFKMLVALAHVPRNWRSNGLK